jgi:DNA-binding CsgD family transcriptional regulator
MANPVLAARAALASEARRPGSGHQFAGAVMAAVGRVVGFDGYCLIGLDPVTGLRSTMFSRHGLDGVAERLAYNETVEVDVNKYAELAGSPRPVGLLGGRRGHRTYSPRLEDIMRPAGFSSELRLALRDRNGWWGALVLFRDSGGRSFSEKDADAALAIAEPLTVAVRSYPLRTGMVRQPALAPGVVTLDANNRVMHVSAHAREWLNDVRAGGDDEVGLDDVMRVVYDVGLAARSRPGQASCLIRTTSGRWLFMHGEPVEPDSQTIAVVLAPAGLDDVLPAASAALGLTRREKHVLGLVARGLTARQVARRLNLSPLTVNDYLGVIYRKADVSGRDELVARLT